MSDGTNPLWIGGNKMNIVRKEKREFEVSDEIVKDQKLYGNINLFVLNSGTFKYNPHTKILKLYREKQTQIGTTDKLVGVIRLVEGSYDFQKAGDEIRIIKN